MKWFNNFRIAKKLISAFFLIALFVAVVGYEGITSLAEMHQNTDTMYEHDVVPITILNEMEPALQQSRILMRDIILTDDVKERQAYKNQIAEIVKANNERNIAYEKTLLTEEGRKIFADYKATLVGFRQARDRIIGLAEEGKKNEALALMYGEGARAYSDVDEKLSQLCNQKQALAKQESEENASEYVSSRNLLIGVIIFSMALAIGLGFWISRLIANPIKKMAESAHLLSVGDINQEIQHESKDEIGSLAGSFRDMIKYINGVAGATDLLSRGDLSVKIEPRSANDVLSNSCQKLKDTMQSLVAETVQLVEEAKNGKLDKRGNHAAFQGSYRELVAGINETLDAVVAPINEAAAVLDRVAARDLSGRVEGNYKGDHAKIKNAINTAVDNLNEALEQVARGAEQITSASNQISSGSQSLAQGASEQASSLEEVSASLQEMSSMTRQNTANAQQARGLTSDATQITQEGLGSMQRLSEAISRIKSSADATAKIIKTIDEIAFQTNLLALNAAVEAARAGDAGKGFAVVAEEVRNLAKRSAEAAKNTADLIEESVKNAEGGVTINQEVLHHLTEINKQVGKVSEVMAEIAAASDQQSEGVGQINQAVEQMNQVTQQTAANAEESAAAAEELTGQAEEMLGMVGSFQLSQVGMMPARKAHPTRSARPAALNGTNRQPAVSGRRASPGNLKTAALASDPKKMIPFYGEGEEAALREF